MNEKDAMDEVLELSDVLASHIAKAMEQLPEADRGHSYNARPTPL